MSLHKELLIALSICSVLAVGVFFIADHFLFQPEYEDVLRISDD